jgi:hypothetical protein
MVIGSLNTEWSEILRKASPQYVEAYSEGYEQAVRDMREMMDRMRAVTDTTTTYSPKEGA